MLETIDGKDFARMITGAQQAFLREHQMINSLNVFPVPDGDTGTNMLLTISAVARAVAEAPDSGIGALAKRAADSAIMGARGNSGVILSQIFRGIARGLAGKQEATSSAVGKAFQYGVLYAYRAVSRPVEGTILSVAKGIAKGAHRAVRETVPFADILQEAITAGREALRRTPEQLPILKQAGVVDAGGQGLITFLSGCLEGLEGVNFGPEAGWDQTLQLSLPAVEEFDIVHPYCTEFVVKHSAVTGAEARALLEPQGDSLVLAESSDVLKVHIHTAHPGAVLETALTWGTLHGIKIDNMADQHRQTTAAPPAAQYPIAVIAVASGTGFSDMMKKLGAQLVIGGGQTMNPPVEDFIAAVHQGQAEKYIVLPNNKNIILAANQAGKLLGDRVSVVPTVTMPQGLAALMAFDPAKSLADNIVRMTERSQAVQSAAITVAVRDSMAHGEAVPAGQYIGVVDSAVLVHDADLAVALSKLAKEMITPATEVVSLYFGDDLTAEAAEELAELLRQQFGVDVEVYEGGQGVYPLIISFD